MENKELLFNLIKKLDSGEIRFFEKTRDDKGKEFYLVLLSEEEKGKGIASTYPVVPKIKVKLANWQYTSSGLCEYEEGWNKEFKENFYKEKRLDKCWVKECPNKIYQTENDYKKVKVQCQDKHTRMVCLGCSKNNN